MDLRKIFASLFSGFSRSSAPSGKGSKAGESGKGRKFSCLKTGEEARVDFRSRGAFYQELTALYRAVGLEKFLPQAKAAGLSSGLLATYLMALADEVAAQEPLEAVAIAKAGQEAKPHSSRARQVAVYCAHAGKLAEADGLFRGLVESGEELRTVHRMIWDEVRELLRLQKQIPVVPPRAVETAYVPNPSKLLWFTPEAVTFSWKNSAVRAQELVSLALKSFAETSVVTRLGYPFDYIRSAQRGATLSYWEPVHYRHFRSPASVPGEVCRGIEFLRQWVLREKPAAIVAGGDGLTTLPALLVARECGIPFVYDFQESVATKPGEREALLGKLEALCVAEADYVLAASSLLTQRAKELGAAESRIVEVPPCFSTLPNEMPECGEGFLFAYAGALEVGTGVELLVETVIALRSEGKPVRLLLVGEGALSEWLAERLAQAGEQEAQWWRVIPEMASAEWRVYLGGAAALVLPTEADAHSTGVVPYSLLEAMALGVPVIAADLPLYRQLIEDGVTGQLVAPGDHDRLKIAMERVMGDRGGVSEMVDWAKARVGERYLGSEVFAQFVDRLRQETGPNKGAVGSEEPSLPLPLEAGSYEIEGLSGAALWRAFGGSGGEGIQFDFAGDELQIVSSLPEHESRTLVSSTTYPLEELGLAGEGFCRLLAAGDLAFEGHYLFLDERGEEIQRQTIHPGEPCSVEVPAGCRSVRLGLTLRGAGRVHVSRWVTRRFNEISSEVQPGSEVMLVAQYYPSTEQIYRYAFIHSRLRLYQREDFPVDVYQMGTTDNFLRREFEGINVVASGQPVVQQAAASGAYKVALVHFMQPIIWSALQKSLDKMKVIVWLHGAEIHSWVRRACDFEGNSQENISKIKRWSVARQHFWRQLFRNPHPNVHYVFVSKHFAEESFSDLGVRLPEDRYSIIHNIIDTDLFAYRPKTAEHRLKFLSIRPFSYRKYANDLTVAAILELSKRPFFKELHFRLIGDGTFFDELTEPLKAFDNVTLEKRFLHQKEIAALHAEYGVFLTPTRMDTQGVSRDEAMSSGLVPITSKVAAIPEFVDESCGFATEPESGVAIADAVEYLYHHPEKYLEMSAAAAARVRAQSSYEQTVAAELRLIRKALGEG